jgi:phospholipase C
MSHRANRLDRRRFMTLAPALALGMLASDCRGPKRAAPKAKLTGPGSHGVRAAKSLSRLPIEHVVILVRENRTYDALFGDFAGGSPSSNVPRCESVMTPRDVPHGREVALHPESHLRCRHSREAAATYHALAREYALCAQFFSEVRGPSFPNHLMLIGAEAPLEDDPRVPPHLWQCPRFCYDFPTFAEQFEDAGLTFKAYDETGFVSSFWMIRRLRHSARIVHWSQFETDARRGTLANLSYVFCEAQDSDHPPFDLCRGQTWTLRQLRALCEGPLWSKSVVFIVWDDWGGFHDHVEPPVVERDAAGRPLRYGHRVPCLVVSPYAKRGYISSQPQSHLSLLSFAEHAFGLPPLNERVREAGSMADCFDFQVAPRKAVLPAPPVCHARG